MAVPRKPDVGVKVTRCWSALTVTVPPLGGWVTEATARGSPLGSLSLPSTGMTTGLFTPVVRLSPVALGGWLRTVTVTVRVTLPPCPSETV